MSNVNDIAGGRLLGTYTPEILFCGAGGDIDYTSNAGPMLDAAAVVQYQILALTAAGVTTFVSGTHTKAQMVIAAQALPAASIGASVPFFSSGGPFNAAILVWPVALDTYAKQLDFVQGTDFHIGQIQNQGKPAWAS